MNPTLKMLMFVIPAVIAAITAVVTVAPALDTKVIVVATLTGLGELFVMLKLYYNVDYAQTPAGRQKMIALRG